MDIAKAFQYLNNFALNKGDSTEKRVVVQITGELTDHLNNLTNERVEVMAALKTFVDRVEEGSISSEKTYAQFKELIEKYGVNSHE